MTKSPPGIGDKWVCIIALALLAIFPTSALSGGAVHGAKAAAMGTAFLAVADDPSAIAHNPAGLTLLKGTNFYHGGSGVILSSEYKSPDGRSERTKFQVFLAPHAYLTSDFGMERLSFGLGIFSLFGIGGRKWSETGLTRYASTDSLIGTVNINPVVAWRVLPELSLAIGFDVLWSLNRSETMVDQSFFGVGDAKLSFKGDGFGFGYNVGLLLFPDKKLSFGFSYRSGTRVKQKGDLALEGIAPALQPVFGGNPFRTKAHTVVNFPEIFGWGVAYRPTPKLTLALDVEWLRWSSFKRLALVLDKKVPAAGFSDIVTDLDWSDAMFIKVGVDYKARENFSLRAGYAYQETPIPEHTLSPGNPDSDQHCFSAGLGYTRGKWVFDGFYTIGFFPDRTVDNAILSGKYKNLIHYFGLSVNYRF